MLGRKAVKLFIIGACLNVILCVENENSKTDKETELELNKTQWMDLIRPNLLKVEKEFLPLHEAREAFHAKYPNKASSPSNHPIVNQSIYFIGDSTFRNQFQAFCIAMHTEWEYTTWEPYVDKTIVRNINDQTLKIKQTSKFNEAICMGQWKHNNVLAAYIEKIEFGSSIEKVMLSLPPPYTNVLPDIIYFGSGQWLMWPVPFTQPVSRWATFEKWKNIEKDINFSIKKYEHLFMKFQNQSMAQKKDIHLVVSTIHSTCEPNEYVGDWYEVFHDYKYNTAKLWKLCIDNLPSYYFNQTMSPKGNHSLSNNKITKSTSPPAMISEKYLEIAKLSACRSGFRNDENVIRMNLRIKSTVSKLINNYISKLYPPLTLKSILSDHHEPRLDLSMLDAYKLTHGHCEANTPKDTIHYVALVFKELELLLNIIHW